MRRDLTGKRAIVTGASGGIGRETSKSLAAAGVRVVVTARSADKLRSLVEEIRAAGGFAEPVVADVTNSADRERLIHAAIEKLGGLDILVNNAGVASWGHFATSTEEVNRQVMEVNFFAPVELTRLAIPHLEKGHQPAVVNVASLAGRIGLPAWPEHAASKHALVGMSEAWRGEFERFGVQTLLILPGLIKADDLSRHLLRREGRAELNFDNATPPTEVASAIVNALRTGRVETVVGRDARWLLRAKKFFPRLVGRLLARRVTQLYR